MYKPKKNNLLEEIHPKIKRILDVNRNEKNGRILEMEMI
jgi:hypothetical protein